MERMRAVVAALALLGWAGFAHALGLGEIEVRSRLNQPILAMIPLSTAGGETDDLVVELANNEEFDRAGLERAEFLSSLRFEVQGETIKVTSRQIAREPFVSFLIDVRWSGGRLLREYTLLLDPPMMTQAQKSPAPAPAPAEAAPSTLPGPSAPAPVPDAAAAPEAPEMAPATAPAPMAASGEGGSYGPISPKETLWSIAYKLRPDPNTITMDQMQVAIFNANPSAFHGGNLTGLMKGVTLRIPSADEIRAVDAAAAKAQVAAARGGNSAAAPAPAPVQQAAAPVPEYTPPPPPPPPKEEPPPAEPAPAPAVTEAPPASVTPPPAEVAQAPVEPAPTPAPVEQQAPPPAPAPAPAETAPAAPVQAAPAPAPEEPGMVAGLLEQARSITEQSWFYPAIAGFVALIVLAIGGRKLSDRIAKWRYERASRKPQVEPAVAAAAFGNEDVTQVAEAPSMEAALQEASSEPAAPPPVAVTQTQALPPMESTQALQSTMQSTLQQTVQQTQVIEPAAARSGKVDFDVTGSFASETVQINLDAGDPVSEAEFHRAYGLYDEAALLLKQAIQKDPKRTDAKVKLAEIYFEASKKNEFVEVARELKAGLPEAEWQKIALLGTQIAPEDPLFAGGAAGAGGTVDLSFDEPAAAPAAAAPAAAPAADAGLDFKLEDVQLPSAPGAPATPAAAPEAGLEFDLGSLSLDAPAAAPAPEPTMAVPAAEAAAPTEKLELGDFDLSAPAAAPAGGGDVVELSADMVPAGGGDESSTKLDLARAYIDMGDGDMARSLLNEVAQQGNADQQKEAQELLKRVAG